MPGLSDDSLKYLTELSPHDWVVRGGWSGAGSNDHRRGHRHHQRRGG